MRLKVIAILSAFLLGACSPRVIPLPVTQGPTLPPDTATPPAINAQVVSPPGLTTIRMIDLKNGWGVSDDKVLRTLDGGGTWYDVSPSGVSALGYAATVDFLDAAHGWVVVPGTEDPLTGTLYRTTDGGATWSSAAVPFGGGVMKFLDADHGWAMASLGAGAGSMGVAILQTDDGGMTWTQNFTNDPNQPGAGDSLPLGGLKDGMTPVDMQTAWVGGVVYTPGVIYLYKTSDSGHSWNQVSVTPPQGYEQAELETVGPQFVTGNDGYLPVHVSSQYGVLLAVYSTHDGGASWVLTSDMIPTGGTMDFVSLNDGFVWNGTDFYVTYDADATWSTVSPDVTFGDGFAGLDFVTPSVGFVLTDDGNGTRVLFKSVDGGSTWNVTGQ